MQDSVFNRADYAIWRHNRMSAMLSWITDRKGVDWFKGKRVIELGCGNGHVGAELTLMGAEVWLLEGRAGNVETGMRMFPYVPPERWLVHDLERGWPKGLGKFDLVIHWGTLYHLGWWRDSLVGAMENSGIISLETEVCDSDSEDLVVLLGEDAGVSDQSLNGAGARLSVGHLEGMLRYGGMHFERLDIPRLNSAHHVYDWKAKNNGRTAGGIRRRFWMCWRHEALHGSQ